MIDAFYRSHLSPEGLITGFWNLTPYIQDYFFYEDVARLYGREALLFKPSAPQDAGEAALCGLARLERSVHVPGVWDIFTPDFYDYLENLDTRRWGRWELWDPDAWAEVQERESIEYIEAQEEAAIEAWQNRGYA